MDEARRFEDLDKAVMRGIEEQTPVGSSDWLARQSSDTLASLFEAIADELARRRALKAGGVLT